MHQSKGCSNEQNEPSECEMSGFYVQDHQADCVKLAK